MLMRAVKRECVRRRLVREGQLRKVRRLMRSSEGRSVKVGVGILVQEGELLRCGPTVRGIVVSVRQSHISVPVKLLAVYLHLTHPGEPS